MSKYSEKFKDPRWQKRRLQVLERDEWMCQICFDNESTLNVHHRYYYKNTNPWDYPLSALSTLCEECHQIETEKRPFLEKSLLHELKKRFFATDLVDIVEGFEFIKFTQSSDVMASILGWALQDQKTQDMLHELYFEHLKQARKK